MSMRDREAGVREEGNNRVRSVIEMLPHKEKVKDLHTVIAGKTNAHVL